MTTDNTSDNTRCGLAVRSSNVRSPNGGAGVKGKHHKPPYNSPDPFLYRTLTYVQLGRDLTRFSLVVICKRLLQMTKCSRSFRFALEVAT
jgi:hypothetical protein